MIWDILIFMFYFTCTQLFLFVFLQMRQTYFGTAIGIFGMLLASIFLIYIMLMLIFFYRFRRQILDEKILKSTFGMISLDSKKTSLWPMVRIFQKFLIVILIIFSYDTPKTLLAIIFVVNILILVFYIMSRPEINRYQRFFNLILEIFFNIYWLVMMIYRVVDSPESRVVLADTNDVILAVYNFMILFLFIANLLYAV